MTRDEEYLRGQAIATKARLRQASRRLADEILGPLDMREIVRRHPWWSLGGAAVSGLAAGLGVRRRGASSGTAAADRTAPGLLARVGRRVRRIMRAVLTTWTVANLRTGTNSERPSSNGGCEPPPASPG